MDFQKEVINASFDQPILVDFWAEWCGPCKMLGPILEELAEEHKEEWKLVKVNTEEHQELATQYGIRSIPNVKLFIEGQVVNEFSGALPKSQIEAWLEEHLPNEAKRRLEEIKSYLSHDDYLEKGLAELALFMEDYPQEKEAVVLWASHRLLEAPELAKLKLETIQQGNDHYDKAKSLLALAHSLSHTFTSKPPKHFVAFVQHLKANQIEAAIKALLESLLREKGFEDELPRRAGLGLFQLLGNNHPLTKKYRRIFDMYLT